MPDEEQNRYTIYEQETGLYKKILLFDEDIHDLYFRNYYKTKTHVLFVFDYCFMKDLENQTRVANVFFFATVETLESNKGEKLIDPKNKVLNVLVGPD